MILILMTSRTGSSMVASIFAAHGFYTGPTNPVQLGSYHTYENEPVKEWIKARKKKMRFRRGEFVRYVPGLEKRIGDNWCVKIGVEYWPLFRELHPRVVTVKRDPDAAARSLADKFDKDPDKVRAMILQRYELLDRARAEAGGAEVSTDEIAAGNFDSIRRAFRHFDIPFDERLARACVDPDKWHYHTQSLSEQALA